MLQREHGYHCKRTYIFILFLLVAFGIGRLAAVEQRVTLRTASVLYTDVEQVLQWGLAGSGIIDVQSERNRVVRGHLQLETLFNSTGFGTLAVPTCSGYTDGGSLCIDVPRAYIRARIQSEQLEQLINVTVGKTRVSWGDGALFNAGDLIFGASSTATDFTQETVRDESALLIATFIPFDAFSFLELVALPPPSTDLTAPASDISAGLRIQATSDDIKTEFGYLYSGAQQRHDIALNIQGLFGIDLYASATTAVSHADIQHGTVDTTLLDELQITIGTLHTIPIDRVSSLSLRLETLLRPSAQWNEQTDTASRPYALLLYPEIIYSVTQSLQLLLRSVISPIDSSASIATGVTWIPYSGLSVFVFPSVLLGDDTDTFSFESAGGFSATIGMQYIF